MATIEIVRLPAKEALLLECKYCKYRWTYQGTSKYRASCPRCRGSVSLNLKEPIQNV